MTADTIFFGGGLPDPLRYPGLGSLIADAVASHPDVLSYGTAWGDDELRNLIAGRLRERAGHGQDGTEVIVTNGCAGALELVARQLVQPGTTVAVERLTYPGAVAIFRRHGATVLPLPLDQDGLDVVALAAMFRSGALTAGASVVYTIATNHSPTGVSLSETRRQELVDLAEEFECTILEDDTYGEIVFADAPRPLFGRSPSRVVHLGSFSKVMAPGLRLGWLAGPHQLAGAIAEARTDLGTPLALQRAAATFIAGGDFERHLTALRTHYRHKRDRLIAALETSCADGGTWNTPEGGFFVWFVLRRGDVAEVECAAKSEGVRFLAGPYFSVGEREGRGIRLAYGELNAEELEEGARRLGLAIRRAG